MDLNTFKHSLSHLQQYQQWSRPLIGGLLGLSILLASLLCRDTRTLVLQPVTLTEEAWIMKEQASRSYHEAWGLFLAQLMGNVTASNLTFVRDTLAPLLDPAIYRETLDVLDQQTHQLREDRVILRFEPRSVFYEPVTGKTFVEGQSFMKGTASKERQGLRTYEYELRISRFLPYLQFMDTYAGPAKTQEFIKKHPSAQQP